MRSEVKALDKLWSEIVKLRAKHKCEFCQKTEYLNSHHIFSRANRSTRWDIDNGVCLCAGHHTLCTMSAHKAPLEFAEWLKARRGEKWYQLLRIRASTVYKPDYKAIKLLLESQKKQYEKAP